MARITDLDSLRVILNTTGLAKKDPKLYQFLNSLLDGTNLINNAVAAITPSVTPVTSGVQSVTDDGNGVVVVDNTDPINPIVGFNGVNVDGVTVLGDGTAGNPLEAVVPAGDYVVMSSGAEPGVPLTDGAGGFIYIPYTP